MVMDKTFQTIIENVKARSRKLRQDGRRCCANQVLNVATYLENEFADLKAVKVEKPAPIKVTIKPGKVPTEVEMK